MRDAWKRVKETFAQEWDNIAKLKKKIYKLLKNTPPIYISTPR